MKKILGCLKWDVDDIVSLGGADLHGDHDDQEDHHDGPEDAAQDADKGTRRLGPDTRHQSNTFWNIEPGVIHYLTINFGNDHIWSNHCLVTPSPIWETGKWNGWFLKKWEFNVWLSASNSFYVTLISDFRSHLFKNSAASSYIYLFSRIKTSDSLQ